MPGENGRGLSRKHVLASIDASLRGSGSTTSISTRSTAGIRRTPIEETMEALHDVVRAGKARYIGASSMYAWQFAKAQSAVAGWTRFVSMQNHYNLIYREEEREMIPQCIDQGVAVSLEPARARPARRQPHSRRRAADDARRHGHVCRLALHTRDRLPRHRPPPKSPQRGASRTLRSRSLGCCTSPASPHHRRRHQAAAPR